MEIREKIKSDLYFFIKNVLGRGTIIGKDFVPHIQGVVCKIIGQKVVSQELLDLLEETKKNSRGSFDYSDNWEVGKPLGLVEFAYPTGFFKTTIKLGAMLWLYLRNHEERQLNCRETTALAESDMHFLLKVLDENKYIQALFPEIYPEKRGRWGTKGIELARKGIYPEPSFQAVGVLSAVRGKHATTIWLDDIAGEKAIRSSATMNRVLDWAVNILTRLASELNNLQAEPFSKVYIIQNRASVYDVHTVFEKEFPDDFLWIRQKALTFDNQSAYPEKYSTEFLLEMANSPDPRTQFKFWTQYMNEPKESKLAEFDTEWLQYFEIEYRDNEFYLNTLTESYKLRECSVLAWIDLAGKAKTKGSQNAIVVLATHPSGKRFVLEAWRKKTTQDEVASVMLNLWQIYPIETIFIENYAQQSQFKVWLERLADEKRISINVKLQTPSSGKYERISSLIFPFQKKLIYIRQKQRELIEEYQAYPAWQYCDLLDALSCVYELSESYIPADSSAIHIPIRDKRMGI